MVALIVLGVVALIGLWIGVSSFKIVGQAEVLVIERLGRFNRVARSGLNILIRSSNGRRRSTSGISKPT